MTALVVGIVGALGGGLISMLTSILTLRSSHRAEQARWSAERRWEYLSGLTAARRESYARFLAQQNAVIMAAGATMNEVRHNHKILQEMPASQAEAYQSFQSASAQSLLLADPPLNKLLVECRNYIDELVWASWRGETFTSRDDLYEDIIKAMQKESAEPPQL